MTDNLMVINNREVTFEPGQTILEAAEAYGIEIPTLCHLKGTTTQILQAPVGVVPLRWHKVGISMP